MFRSRELTTSTDLPLLFMSSERLLRLGWGDDQAEVENAVRGTSEKSSIISLRHTQVSQDMRLSLNEFSRPCDALCDAIPYVPPVTTATHVFGFTYLSTSLHTVVNLHSGVDRRLGVRNS